MTVCYSKIGFLVTLSGAPRPFDCGFKIAKYGPQQDSDPYDTPPSCGNGRHPDGSLITGNDPADTSMSVTPSCVWASG